MEKATIFDNCWTPDTRFPSSVPFPRISCASICCYGLPLGGIVAATAVAGFLDRALDDQLAVILAVGGLTGGVLLGRYYLNKDGCLKNFVPTISERNA